MSGAERSIAAQKFTSVKRRRDRDANQFVRITVHLDEERRSDTATKSAPKSAPKIRHVSSGMKHCLLESHSYLLRAPKNGSPRDSCGGACWALQRDVWLSVPRDISW